ncbi:MAG: dynamin family protein [Roseovarius sp.]
MTKETTQVSDMQPPMGQPPRKTRLALMGEFSAGKSTLSKLFLGDAPLPVKVTATRLPPVWISHGPSAAFAVGHDGVETPIALDAIDQVRIEDTRMIRLFNPSETLEICDLIDMPGISDPNMSSDVWLSVMDDVDSVVWCTQATQAWRQSEAATWESISERTNGANILLVTQVDKLGSARDLDRVMMRVRKETKGQFQHVFPLSIIDAIAAGDDEAEWEASGAGPFIDTLVELLMSPPARVQETGQQAGQQAGQQDVPKTPDVAAQATPQPAARKIEAQPKPDTVAHVPTAAPTAAPTPQPAAQMPERAAPVAYGATSVMPKRVRVLTQMRGRTARPGSGGTVNL